MLVVKLLLQLKTKSGIFPQRGVGKGVNLNSKLFEIVEKGGAVGGKVFFGPYGHFLTAQKKWGKIYLQQQLHQHHEMRDMR